MNRTIQAGKIRIPMSERRHGKGAGCEFGGNGEFGWAATGRRTLLRLEAMEGRADTVALRDLADIRSWMVGSGEFGHGCEFERCCARDGRTPGTVRRTGEERGV